MTQSSIDFVAPLSVEACATRLRQRALQLSKQRDQQRRNKEWCTLEVVSEGKDAYRVRLSKGSSGFIGAKLDAHLRKNGKNQTQVNATTHIDRFTKSLAILVSTVVVIYLLAGVGGMLSLDWFVLAIVGFALTFGPLYAAHRLKEELIKLFRHWLETSLHNDSGT